MAAADVNSTQLDNFSKQQLQQTSRVMDPETRRRKRAIAVSMLSRALAMFQSSADIQADNKRLRLAVPAKASKQHVPRKTAAVSSNSSSKRVEQRSIKIADVSTQVNGAPSAIKSDAKDKAKELRQPRRSLGLSRVYKQDVDISQLPPDYWEYFPDAADNARQTTERLLASRSARQAQLRTSVDAPAAGVLNPVAGHATAVEQQAAHGAATQGEQAQRKSQAVSGIGDHSADTPQGFLDAPPAVYTGVLQQPHVPSNTVSETATSSNIYAALLQQLQQPSSSSTQLPTQGPGIALPQTTPNNQTNAVSEPVPAVGLEQGLDQGLADDDMDQEGEEPEAVLPPPSPDWEDI